MGQILYGSATTTEATRRAIQNSYESLRAFVALWGNVKAVDKWRKRQIVSDAPMGPKVVKSTVLSTEEAIIVTFRVYFASS